MSLLGVPISAQAHLVNSGFGPFYDGISHLLLSPEELLGVVGLALLAGLGGARGGRWTLFTLPAAWFLGGLIGLRWPLPFASWVVVTALFLLIIGVLVALDRPVPVGARTALAIGFGLVQGGMNGSVAAVGGLGVGGLLGIGVTVFVLVAIVAAAVVRLGGRPPWTRVAIRVAGSWIAAIGLLLTGWSLR